jgi:2'-hydroxyisoflavone reductase
MRILVLGGTGFIGPHMVRYAQKRGHKVTLFNRGKTNPGLFPNVETLIGDRDNDLESLKGHTWDVVIDNSASIPRWVRQSAELLKDSAELYLFTSSLSVHADFSKEGITEEDPVATIDDPTIEQITGQTYGPLKALCEREAEKAFRGRALIIRPHLIVGPGDPTDRWTYWPVRVDRGGEVMAPGTPDDPTQYIDARDLAEWYIHMLEERETGVYSCVGPKSKLTMGELLYGMRAVVSNDISFTWVDADFMSEHQVAPWQHMTAWLPARGETAGFGLFDNSKAVGKGLEYRPLAVTARETLDWWKTLPEERISNPRAGLAAEKEKEVLAAWHTLKAEA